MGTSKISKLLQDYTQGLHFLNSNDANEKFLCTCTLLVFLQGKGAPPLVVFVFLGKLGNTFTLNQLMR